MSTTVAVSLDLPNLAEGVAFYCAASPVHLDFHVDDLHPALQHVEALGAKREQVFEHAGHGSAAFCTDPFGHGFCLLGREGKR